MELNLEYGDLVTEFSTMYDQNGVILGRYVRYLDRAGNFVFEEFECRCSDGSVTKVVNHIRQKD